MIGKLTKEGFNVPSNLIGTLLNTDEFHGLLLYGAGGLGKTVCTMDKLHAELREHEIHYQNGYTTPLALYETLHTYRDYKVIVLDDVEGLFGNKLSVSILKGALWKSDGVRKVSYTSTSSILAKRLLPYAFPIKAKIIIMCNEVPNFEKPDLKALVNRMLAYEVRFTYQEKMDICKEFLFAEKMSEPLKERVLDVLTKNTSAATVDFSFRTLKKAIAFVKSKPADADRLFASTTPVDMVKMAYLEIHGKFPNIAIEVDVFEQVTGLSRATYFRIKKEMEYEVGTVSKSHESAA